MGIIIKTSPLIPKSTGVIHKVILFFTKRFSTGKECLVLPEYQHIHTYYYYYYC